MGPLSPTHSRHPVEAVGKKVAGPREQDGPEIGKQQSRDPPPLTPFPGTSFISFLCRPVSSGALAAHNPHPHLTPGFDQV